MKSKYITFIPIPDLDLKKKKIVKKSQKIIGCLAQSIFCKFRFYLILYLSNVEKNPKQITMQQHKPHKNRIFTILNHTKNLT